MKTSENETLYVLSPVWRVGIVVNEAIFSIQTIGKGKGDTFNAVLLNAVEWVMPVQGYAREHLGRHPHLGT